VKAVPPTIRPGGSKVVSPIAATPKPVSAPAELKAATVSGTASVEAASSLSTSGKTSIEASSAPKVAPTIRVFGFGLDLYSAYTMARDKRIAEQFAGYAGSPALEDESGQYTLARANTVFTFYDKTYTSGVLKGKTLELGYFDSRKETEKLESKYGHFDWMGEFIQGRVPPIYVDPHRI
jgi:hypothetical protein